MQRLVDRFFDGETTIEEESRLYAYFAGNDVADELLPYREIMADFGSLPYEEKATEVPLKAKRRRLWPVVAAVAASLLVFFGAWQFYRAHTYETLASLYGGSYIIVDGKRIDDLRQIKPQIERTLAAADAAERRFLVEDAVRNAENEVLNSVEDPVVRAEISKMLQD